MGAQAGLGVEAGAVGGHRWEEWGGKQTLSQAINQRHSYCRTIIQSSLLRNSARGSTGLAVSFHPSWTGRSGKREGGWGCEGVEAGG